MIKRIGYSGFAIFAIAVLVWGINNNLGFWKKGNRVISSDGFYYYAYLPAVFVYQDLELNYVEGGHAGDQFIVWPKITEEGKKVIVTSMGVAMAASPFFLIGHAWAGLSDFEQDGYSPPYKFMMLVSAWFYLLIGLILIRKFLLQFFSDKIVTLVLLAVALGTNLLWYVVEQAVYSHVYSFALIAAFICLTHSWFRRISFAKSLGIGLIAGLITLIRPTNALVLLLFVLWNVTPGKDFFRRIKFFAGKWQHILIMAIAAFLVWMPQMAYWHMLTGQWFYYSYPDDQGFFFGNPQILNNLFSWRKGWLLYTPVMVFALGGIIALYRYHKNYFLPVLIFTLTLLYITSSWWDWWYGGGLGMRPYIDMYAVMALPMAASIDWIYRQKRVLKTVLIALFLLLAFRGSLHHLQYHYNAIHWDSMTREAYLDSFFRIQPSDDFNSLLKEPDYELARKGIYRYKGNENGQE